jgi:hypothetical protein
MINVNVKISFDDSGYIGLPFWPERNELINIQKEVHPKLQGAKREAAINAALDKRGFNQSDYARLQTLAARPFHTVNGQIAIPARSFISFINHASMEAPKAIPKIQNKGLTFIAVKVRNGYLIGDKTDEDAKVFGRFVANKESNQRRWDESKYVDQITFSGSLQVDEEIIKPENLKKLIEWGGKMVGIGSSRPQGFGRFRVVEWEAQE